MRCIDCIWNDICDPFDQFDNCCLDENVIDRDDSDGDLWTEMSYYWWNDYFKEYEIIV